MRNLKIQETIPAVIDGEEVTIYNWLNIAQRHVVRGHNPEVETFDPGIGAGDSMEQPRYVTEWVAESAEGIGVDLWGHPDIVVVDPESEGVELL